MEEQIRMYACYEDKKAEIILKPKESFHGLNVEEKFYYEAYKKLGLHPFFQKKYMIKIGEAATGGAFLLIENAEIYFENEASFKFKTEYGHEFTLTFEQEKKIGEIKKLIQKKIGIFFDKLHLFYKNIELDSNNDNLVSFNEKHNYILFGKYKTEKVDDNILVKFIKDKDMDLKIINKTDNDNIIKVSINSTDSTEHLYDLVSQKIGHDITKDNEYFLKIGHKYFSYTNQYIYDFHYNFGGPNVLTLQKADFFVFVTDFKDLKHKVCIFCEPSETIENMERRIEEEVNDYQTFGIRLIYLGKSLNSNQTLEDCGVKKGSTLIQIQRLRG